MKTKFFFLIFMCLSWLSVMADDSGDVNFILRDYIIQYEKATTDEDKALYLHRIIIEASYADIKMSKAYTKELKKLADTVESKIPLVRYYNVQGVISYFDQVPLDSTLYWYDLALQTITANNIKDIDLEISLFNNRGNAYEVEGKTNLAIKEYLAALDMLNKLDEKSYTHETLIYSNIAFMMLVAKRYEEVYEYAEKAISSNNIVEAKTNKRSDYFEFIHLTKGEALYNLGRIDESEIAIRKVLDHDNKLNQNNNLCQIFLGKILAKKNKVELARTTLTKAYKNAEKLDLGIYNQVLATLGLAEIELDQDNPTSSLEHMDAIFRLYESANTVSENPEVYKMMAKALERSGRFEESLHHTKQYQVLVDEEKEEATKVKFGEMEAQLTNLEKEYHINDLEIKQKLQESKMSVLITAFLLSVLLLLFIYFMYKKKEDHNQALLLINEEVTMAKDNALAAAKAKENFLSTMSHEMRTPMNAVIGITNILLDEDPNSKQVEHLNNLKFSGEGLLNIINEVLDFSKIEASKLEIVNTPFHLQVFLDKMMSSIKHGSKNKSVKIFQDQQLAPLKNIINGDKKRIGQILTNLLGNAIKFTNAGHIVLRSRILEDVNNTVKVLFQVEDSGIGIPMDKLESIFESFTQVNNDINRTHQGTGLGLSISKQLVELQGGNIEVGSKEGHGTTFNFTLQFEKAHIIPAQKPAAPSSKIFKSGIEGTRILLVEDNKLNQLVAMKVLKKFKVEAEVAENGQEALEMVQKKTYDLILMDIHMPIMDGIEATTSIRALEDTRINAIPIIALSADAYSDKVNAATKCGMNDYLSKPFKPAELFQKIKTNLDSAQALRG